MSANVCAALVTAALLSGCGGGHRGQTSSSDTRTQSSAAPPATSATSRTAALPTPAAYWPYQKLVGSLAGRTLGLPRGPVRLNAALLECNGKGAPASTGATRRWSRYVCTQTLFQNGVDLDVTFDVTIVSPTQLSITAPRYGPE